MAVTESSTVQRVNSEDRPSPRTILPFRRWRDFNGTECLTFHITLPDGRRAESTVRVDSTYQIAQRVTELMEMYQNLEGKLDPLQKELEALRAGQSDEIVRLREELRAEKARSGQLRTQLEKRKA